MSVLISGFAALGAFAPEANPSLQGQTIYTKGAKDDLASLQLLDKQIQRIIGKARECFLFRLSPFEWH